MRASAAAGLGGERGERLGDRRRERGAPAPRGRCAAPARKAKSASASAKARRRRAAAGSPRPARPAKTAAVATGTPGLASTSQNGGSVERREALADAAHPAGARRRGRPARRRRGRAAPPGAGSGTCQSRASRRSVAAASAEPPPMPLATGSDFVSRSAAPRPGGRRSARGAQHEVVGAGAEVAGERAVDAPARGPAAGSASTRSPSAREDDEAVEQVVAVGAAAGDVQREVDLGGRELRRARAGRRLSRPAAGSAASTASSPTSSLRRMRSMSRSSAGPKRERAAPLELGLALAADLPEHVAEVVVDHRVVGRQLDGAQHRRHRLLVAAEPVEHPAERVGDVAVVGLGRATACSIMPSASSRFSLLLDQAVAEIVQHQRLVGLELQRLRGSRPRPRASRRRARWRCRGCSRAPSAPARGVVDQRDRPRRRPRPPRGSARPSRSASPSADCTSIWSGWLVGERGQRGDAGVGVAGGALGVGAADLRR